MAAHKFKPFQREKVRADIAALRLQGFRSFEIAERVGLRRQSVDWHLSVIEKRWRESAAASTEQHRARLLAASEQRKRMAFEAFEASRAERRSTRTRQRKVPNVQPASGDMPGVITFPRGGAAERIEQEAMVRVEQRREGDWHWIDALRKEDEFQARLLGLVDQPPALDPGEPVRRVVVYMERPPDGMGEEPLPPGDGPVIDVPSGLPSG